MKQLQVAHFSDVLCVWAYVSQIRINELLENFGDQIDMEYLYFSVFGNALDKIDKNWESKGGRAAYADHVRGVVDQFGHLPVHEDIWQKNAPSSSLPAHLYICAAQLAETDGNLNKDMASILAWHIRVSFFAEARDISNKDVLRSVIEEKDISIRLLETYIDSGQAFARMSAQMQRAVDGLVRSSPTLSFNEDRQRLTGNVGYRIIESNVRELLERTGDQQTWC